jgi:hypothetical protein
MLPKSVLLYTDRVGGNFDPAVRSLLVLARGGVPERRDRVGRQVKRGKGDKVADERGQEEAYTRHREMWINGNGFRSSPSI